MDVQFFDVVLGVLVRLAVLFSGSFPLPKFSAWPSNVGLAVVAFSPRALCVPHGQIKQGGKRTRAGVCTAFWGEGTEPCFS